ncbi:hypothetical protein LJR231_001849 [Phyllobacterium sp. LjRoot231]|uniref:hypothetical protein n=1 Tax=Phyllobacterium sp. LjRoot231 TaxID=3342289 RepID=UPI003ECFA543
MRDNADLAAAERYFGAIRAALDGLEVFLNNQDSPLYKHDLVAQTVSEYLQRLDASFECWRNRLGFAERFRISKAESGFPVFQNVLELENDKKDAKERLSAIPPAEALRSEMADFILRNREFPRDLQKSMAERIYLETVTKGDVFSPFLLPVTIRVSVNPKTMRPFYVVHWGAFDGASNLPLIYMAVIEDSSEDMVETLVSKDGKLNTKVRIPLPVGGLLNPDLARRFDDFAAKNSAYSLSPVTIATSLDQDFPELHPKQLRRVVLGPFYTAGITEHNQKVADVLERVRKPEDAWLLTWTLQEVFSKAEKPGKRGLWSSEPSREEFHINTDDLEAARQGVSHYEQHALVPHEAYQALYASGEAARIFTGFETHILSNGQVISGI